MAEIALVGFPSDLTFVLDDALREEGHALHWIDLDDEARALLGKLQPQLILLMVGRDQRALPLLDALREHPDTEALPVIVLGTVTALRAQAQASGNVHAVLRMPFELDDLLHAVETALVRAPFETRVTHLPREPDPAVAHAGDLLVAAERSLMLDWVQRIREVEPFASHAELSTRDFLDSLPRILHALTVLLRRQEPTDVLEGDPDARDRIQRHARTRWGQGIPVEAVLHEYQVLRQGLLERVQRDMPAGQVLGVMAHVSELLDQAQRITAREYMRLIDSGRKS